MFGEACPPQPRTDFEGIVQAGVGDERDRRVEALRVLEDIERELDRVALELLLDPFERLLHPEPKIDFLTRRAARDVPAQLGHGLDLFDPAVDLALQAVQEGRVGEQGRVDQVGARADACTLRLGDRSADDRVDREDDLGDLDVLLDCATISGDSAIPDGLELDGQHRLTMQQGQFELGKLLLRDGDTHLGVRILAVVGPTPDIILARFALDIGLERRRNTIVQQAMQPFVDGAAGRRRCVRTCEARSGTGGGRSEQV